MTQQQFEMVFETNAEVIRGCCGQAHDPGECPNVDNSDTDQED